VLQAAVIGRDVEVLVLDMGEQVRIVDMARRLTAAVPRRVEIEFTGLRPGEKLTEDLLGAGELDLRPFHPLIRHVPVAPLRPDLVMSLDPADGGARLRAGLARCAAADANAAVTSPPVARRAGDRKAQDRTALARSGSDS
jgi:hypothetical protein